MIRIGFVLSLLAVFTFDSNSSPVNNIQAQDVLNMLRLGDLSFLCEYICDPDYAKAKSVTEFSERSGVDARLFCWLCDDVTTTIAPVTNTTITTITTNATNTTNATTTASPSSTASTSPKTLITRTSRSSKTPTTITTGSTANSTTITTGSPTTSTTVTSSTSTTTTTTTRRP